jgi:hypothetical protein
VSRSFLILSMRHTRIEEGHRRNRLRKHSVRNHSLEESTYAEAQTSVIAERWSAFGQPPLSIRLKLPELGLTVDSPTGAPPTAGQARALHEARKFGSEVDLEVQFVARPRGAEYEVGEIWAGEMALPAALSALGWGNGLVGEHETTSERLRHVSNDYWLVARLAAFVGLESLATTPATNPTGGVSFVVPARGVESTIDEVTQAIAWSAEVAGVDWECIIADDASDPVLALPAGHGDRVRVVRSNERIYCGGARNLGMTYARYDTLIFCDGDTLVSPFYVREHLFRHLLVPNLICVSMREQLPAGVPVPDREPDSSADTRVSARYSPGRLGLIPVKKEMEVRAIEGTSEFRDFGLARTLGPVDLAFMVKGNNLSVSRGFADIRFPPDFVGYGPEDGAFAAKAIARGAFVVPVLSASVFHREHPPRSGSFAERDMELVPNLSRQRAHLADPVWQEWASR